ncbi:MAG: hypothetical protein EZS28_005208, partial [Streblomastix strix]
LKQGVHLLRFPWDDSRNNLIRVNDPTAIFKLDNVLLTTSNDDEITQIRGQNSSTILLQSAAEVYIRNSEFGHGVYTVGSLIQIENRVVLINIENNKFNKQIRSGSVPGTTTVINENGVVINAQLSLNDGTYNRSVLRIRNSTFSGDNFNPYDSEYTSTSSKQSKNKNKNKSKKHPINQQQENVLDSTDVCYWKSSAVSVKNGTVLLESGKFEGLNDGFSRVGRNIICEGLSALTIESKDSFIEDGVPSSSYWIERDLGEISQQSNGCNVTGLFDNEPSLLFQPIVEGVEAVMIDDQMNSDDSNKEKKKTLLRLTFKGQHLEKCGVDGIKGFQIIDQRYVIDQSTSNADELEEGVAIQAPIPSTAIWNNENQIEFVINSTGLSQDQTWVVRLLYGQGSTGVTSSAYAFGYLGDSDIPSKGGLSTAWIIIIIIIVFLLLVGIILFLTCLAVYFSNKKKRTKKRSVQNKPDERDYENLKEEQQSRLTKEESTSYDSDDYPTKTSRTTSRYGRPSVSRTFTGTEVNSSQPRTKSYSTHTQSITTKEPVTVTGQSGLEMGVGDGNDDPQQITAQISTQYETSTLDRHRLGERKRPYRSGDSLFSKSQTSRSQKSRSSRHDTFGGNRPSDETYKHTNNHTFSTDADSNTKRERIRERARDDPNSKTISISESEKDKSITSGRSKPQSKSESGSSRGSHRSGSKSIPQKDRSFSRTKTQSGTKSDSESNSSSSSSSNQNLLAQVVLDLQAAQALLFVQDQQERNKEIRRPHHIRSTSTAKTQNPRTAPEQPQPPDPLQELSQIGHTHVQRGQIRTQIRITQIRIISPGISRGATIMIGGGILIGMEMCIRLRTRILRLIRVHNREEQGGDLDTHVASHESQVMRQQDSRPLSVSSNRSHPSSLGEGSFPGSTDRKQKSQGQVTHDTHGADGREEQRGGRGGYESPSSSIGNQQGSAFDRVTPHERETSRSRSEGQKSRSASHRTSDEDRIDSSARSDDFRAGDTLPKDGANSLFDNDEDWE